MSTSTFRTPPGRSSVRITVMRVLVVSLFATLAMRLWSLQILQADHYQTQAQDNRVREAITPAPRGLIVDDAGRVIASNRTTLVVSADRSVLDRQSDKGAAVLTKLAGVLGMKPIELAAATRLCTATVPQPCWNGSPYQPIPVATDVTPEKALSILEHPESYPGIVADTQALRTYPFGPVAGHEVGYVGPISQAQLDKSPDRTRTDTVGLGGLEQEYDGVLRGQNGIRKLAVDRFGRVSGEVSSTPATVGDTLVLGTDMNVQQALEDSLNQAVAGTRSKTASGVVLDATNGQVVAMASLPGYDPSAFVGGISQEEYQKLNDASAGTPLFSRAYQGSGAVGSTFKPFTLAAAVGSGNPLRGNYDCGPSLQVGDQVFHNFEGSSAGSISLKEALVISCDVIFDKFAYDSWLADGGLRKGPGPYPSPQEVYVRNAEMFGFGARTGVDLPGETAGAIVDRSEAIANWNQLKDSYCRRAQNGYPEEPDASKAAQFQKYAREACIDGYLYNGGAATQFAIGQGAYLNISPLQLATGYAAIANGGTLYEPHLAKAVLNPDGTLDHKIEPKVKRKMKVDPAVLDYIRDSLGEVTTRGTAAGAFGGFPMQQVHVAGKTGTAEVEGQGDTSWFASFGPLPQSKYVVVMSIPNAGRTGGEVAAPAARKVWEALYGIGRPGAFPDNTPPTKLPAVRADGSTAPVGREP
ncbi:MAG: penicillin-binding protein 2 [Actinomycetota bacterium]|nr:penicillin-binding protein 2 [Actinomycetota bacterium]